MLNDRYFLRRFWSTDADNIEVHRDGVAAEVLPESESRTGLVKRGDY